MSDTEKMEAPEHLLYSNDHEWVMEEDNCKIGITDFAQDQLGDIVFVELPEPGAVFEQDEEFGSIESVKAVASLLMPVSGEIVAVNDDLVESPELVNKDPYENWIVRIKPRVKEQFSSLMDQKAYTAMLRNE